MNSQRTKNLTVTLLLALAIFCTGWLGMMLPAFGSTITLIWMPTGIAVAVLFRWGFRWWPGLALGGIAANLAIGTPWPVVLGIAVGNILAPILAAWTLRRVGFHPAFDRSRDILQLAGAAALGMLISSSLGVTALSLGGIVREGRLAAWLTWWAGDSMGVILAAPLVFAFVSEERRVILRRGAEFLTWLGVTCVVTWGVFVFNHGSDGRPWALAFLPLPLLVWGTLRFGGTGTSLAVIVLAVGAAYGTATGRGPFFRANPMEGIVVLWIYMATSATLGWLISALQAKRQQSVGIQRLFEQALSDVSLGVLLAGLDRRITYANQGFTRLTGYTEAELLGKSCGLLQGPETDPATAERLKTAVFGDGFFDGEILNYCKDGTSFWNGLLISPVRDERGAMTGFLGIQRDITKRKQAEFALSQSEEHLRTIIELEPECVKILSPEGMLLEMNPAGLAMIEAGSLEEVRGCPLTEIIVPEDRDAFTEMHRRAMQGATGRCEFAIVTLKGTRRWLETHAVPYRNAQREIIGVLGITRDVTARLEAAAELERSFSTLQLFINTVPAYISFVDADERYRLVNKSYEDYFGLPAERLIGQRLCDVQPPAAYAEMQPHIRTALAGQTVRYQSHPTGPDGKTYWFDVQYVPRRGEDGAVTGFFVLVFDISENKKAEIALRESEESFRRLIEHAPEAVMLLDVTAGRFVQVNPAAERMFRMSAAELCQVGPDMMSPPTQPDGRPSNEKTREYVAQAMEGGTPVFEWTHRDAEGRDFPCEVRLLRLEIGGRVVVRGSTTDITERKRAEEAVHTAAEFTKSLIGSMQDGFSVLGADGVQSDVNPAFCRMTGFSREALIGTRPPYPYWPPEEHERIQTALGETMNGRFADFELTFMRQNGERFPAIVSPSAVRNLDGSVRSYCATVKDITGRKRAEEALRESEGRYRTLFEANPHPMWVYDLESLRFLAVNAAAIAHYGYSRDEFLAMTLKDIRPPEDIPALLANVEAVDEGLDHAGVWRHRKRDGKIIDVEISSHVIDFDGRQAEVVLANDVTERRRSEVRSAGERAVLEQLASGAPLSAVLDRLARSYEEIFPGMLCSVLLMDPDGKHLRHGAAPSLPEAFCQAIDGVKIGPAVGSCGTAALTRQMTLVADIATDPLWKDYREIALAHGLRACWSVPVMSAQNRVLGTIALYYRQPASPNAEEIAAIERAAHFASLAIERHELLRSLQESQVRLQTLVSNLPGMAYRCLNDPTWTMSYVSEGCEAVTGYRRDELENNRTVAYADRIHVEDREWLWAKCQKSLDARTPCLNEYRILDRHGRERWVSERASGVYAEDGALLAIDGFIQDITVSRQAKLERELLDRKMQETQKLESLGVLAGGIAHDFNNLLTAILGNASIAQLELPPGSSAQDCLEQINEASLRAADLCKQMLAYSGRGRFVVQTLDLGQLVEQTAQMLQISISKKAVLRYRLEKGLPPVEVDATQIRQVIMNLVINASEAIGDKSGAISISTGLTRVDRDYLRGTLMDPDLPERDYVFLEVSDSGSGMSAETQARIFDPFFTTKFTGRGLGLAAVLGIVRGHKGAMKVYSEVERGTTFKLLFPAATGAVEGARTIAGVAQTWRGEGTVLVVDDEETMRSTVARMMRLLGLDPVLASDGREGVEIFRAQPEKFALVLLDLTMPHMDGEQTFTELRRLRPDVRVVLMSGFNAQEALVRFPGKGLASFLQKPFTIDAVRAVLQDVLGSSKIPPPS